MFDLINTQDRKGKDLRIIFNNDGINQSETINAQNLLVVVLKNKTNSEELSWQEIEEQILEKIQSDGKAVFFSRVNRQEQSELYYYVNDEYNESKLNYLDFSYIDKKVLVKDQEYFVFNEMKQLNFLTTDSIGMATQSKDLFEMWKELEIDVCKEFYIMFSFYSIQEDLTKKFVEFLKNLNFDTTSKSKRTLIIFKGYVTQAERKQNWNEQKLISTFFRLILIANKFDISHEGIFARK